MQSYIYGFRLERVANEVFFRFPKMPEIISALPSNEVGAMTPDKIQAHAVDAVVTALAGDIEARLDIPEDDEIGSEVTDGFVVLPVQQAMKIELYKIFRAHSKSVAQFARTIGKTETAAHRLLDLHHKSKVEEIEGAVASFGRRFVTSWEVDAPLQPVRDVSTPHL